MVCLPSLQKHARLQAEPSPPLCLFLLAALARGKEEHWRIEPALEFHPLYCKEDLVLLNTSCLLFSHRLVTASWGLFFLIKHTCIRLVGKQTAQVHVHTQACSGRIQKDRCPPTLQKSPYDIREIQTRLRGALCLPPTASAMDPRSCN